MSIRYSPRIAAFLIVCLTANLTFLSPASAGERTIQLNEFFIAQEIFRNNGVLVIRPRDLDVKLMNLMRSEDIHSLEDYAAWLKANVTYKKDGKLDIWTEPQDTLKIKSGDCEDYTLLTTAMLKVLGYEPQFLALKGKNQAHAICVFKKDGVYHWFDNAELKQTDAETLTDLAGHLFKNNSYSSLFEIDIKKRAWNLISKRS